MSAGLKLRMAVRSFDVEADERRAARPQVSRFKQEAAIKNVVEAVRVEASKASKANAQDPYGNMTLLVTRAMRCGIDEAAIMRAVDELPNLPVNARDSMQAVMEEVMANKARLAEQAKEKARLKAERARQQELAEHEAKLAEDQASERIATARRRKEATGSLLASLERAGADDLGEEDLTGECMQPPMQPPLQPPLQPPMHLPCLSHPR